MCKTVPYAERKKRLKKMFSPKPRHALLVIQSIPDTGLELFEHAVALELEGIIGKRKDSVYVLGERTQGWRKVRRPGAVLPERFRFK